MRKGILPSHRDGATNIYGPRQAGFAVDFTGATPQEVEKYRDEYCLVLYPALREGRLIRDTRAD
jgi:hypothetical protein